MAKQPSINLGQLQSDFTTARSKHTAASTLRNNARTALARAEKGLEKAEEVLSATRAALKQGTNTVTE